LVCRSWRERREAACEGAEDGNGARAAAGAAEREAKGWGEEVGAGTLLPLRPEEIAIYKASAMTREARVRASHCAEVSERPCPTVDALPTVHELVPWEKALMEAGVWIDDVAMRPRRVGDGFVDTVGQRWIWLPDGSRRVTETERWHLPAEVAARLRLMYERSEAPEPADFMAAVRDVARGW